LLKQIAIFLRERKIGSDSVRHFLLKSSIFVVLAVLAAAFFPAAEKLSYNEYVVGSVVTREIIAPFTFPILKDTEKLNVERHAAAAAVLPVYEFQADKVAEELNRWRSFTSEIARYADSIQTSYPAESERLRLSSPTSISSVGLLEQLDSLQIIFRDRLLVPLDRSRLLALLYLQLNDELDAYAAAFSDLLRERYSTVVVNSEKDSLPAAGIMLRRGGVNEEVPLSGVTDVDEAIDMLLLQHRSRFAQQILQMRLAPSLARIFVVANWHYSEQITGKLRREAIAAIPTSEGFVYKNERIIDSHEIVSRAIFNKLQSLAVAINAQNPEEQGIYRWRSRFGGVIFSLLLFGFFASYLFAFRQNEIWERFSRLLMIALIFALQLVAGWVVLEILEWPQYTVPMIFAAMLLVILLDASVAFLGTVVLALLLATVNGMDFSYAIVNLMAGIGAIYAIRKIRRRTQIFFATFASFIAYVVSLAAIALMRHQGVGTVVDDITFIAANTLLTPIIVFGIIGVFERLFDVTTGFSLLELGDMNHPLLKRLSQEASGTFSHSIEVANLAEAGAMAIGADSLLTRVGCYYHDIGKMEKPEYFVENQQGKSNRHENLTPSMSAIVIAAHVKKGLELADRHHLPEAIKAFIPEHHGTTPMEYFLHKAKEANPGMEIDENSFRYPGPRPRRKETAVVMLADTIEAASRTLKDPSASRIQSLLDTLIEKKISDRQLDESSLTFKEISLIKKAFLNHLLAKYHLRIDYPDEQKKKAQESGESN
jgi:putative nucleotidyltransferase with HDIG domain